MSLDDIACGSLCVIDTNVLLYAEHGASPQAQRLLRRCGSGEIIGIPPQPVWQELIHKLMLAEALMLEKISGPDDQGQVVRLGRFVPEQCDQSGNSTPALAEPGADRKMIEDEISSIVLEMLPDRQARIGLQISLLGVASK